MSYSYDFFVGHLRCPVCQTVSEASYQTYMQTYIRDVPSGAMLGEGDPLPLSLKTLPERDYIALRPVHPGESIHLAQQWTCPTCHTEGLWAEITLADDTIRSIQAVPLLESLDRLHFVHVDVVDIIQAKTGLPYDEIMSTNLASQIQMLQDGV